MVWYRNQDSLLTLCQNKDAQSRECSVACVTLIFVLLSNLVAVVRLTKFYVKVKVSVPLHKPTHCQKSHVKLKLAATGTKQYGITQLSTVHLFIFLFHIAYNSFFTSMGSSVLELSEDTSQPTVL